MTPKEKAIKLVNKYLQIYDGRVTQAKECALIAVDEIINVVKRYETKKGRLLIDNINLLYWQEVKQEMQKL